MAIETGGCSMGMDSVGRSPAGDEVMGDSALLAEAETSSGLDADILTVCDRIFTPLMASAMETAPSDGIGALAPAYCGGFGEDSENELEKYRAQLKAGGKASMPFCSCPTPLIGKAGKIVPRQGLGPRVFIGFDAEWEFQKRGRNRILSVQFFLIGPTGQVLQKVLHLYGGDRVDERPALDQCLSDLLDEALDEGVLLDWPCEVVLAGFFTRADITVFSDFKALRAQLDGVGGTLATVQGAAHVTLPMKPERETYLKARYQFTVGDAYDPRMLRVRIVDVKCFAPPGQSLAGIGKFIGVEKLDLPKGFSKDAMAEFQRKDVKRFEAYGLRDAEIAVTFLLWVFWFSNRRLGLPGLSATASGLAVRIAELCIAKDGATADVALNFETVKQVRWNNKTQRPVTSKKRKPSRIRQWLEPFLADAYVGGRNECYMFGATQKRRFYDPDLAGAYVTGLSYVMALNYDQAVMTKEVKDYLGHVAGFASVKFRFPPGTKYPCLPVNVESRGLLFPVSGESLCTAPEIELAVAMGAEIEIIFGLVIPWMERNDVFDRSRSVAKQRKRATKAKKELTACADHEIGSGIERDCLVHSRSAIFPPPSHGDIGYRPFESFAIHIREMRGKYRRKSLPFEFVKLLGNSLYGKTGQGFKRKRTFGPKEMGGVIVGPSRVSEAAIAALVCGFIRAVLGEILWKLPEESTVVSATTDGFLLDRPIDELDLSGVLCKRFQALVDRVAPGTKMLENKHTVMQILAMRARGQLTGERDGEHPIVVAKAGVKPDRAIEDENAYMVDLFVNRRPGQSLPRESFISMRDQLTRGWDLQTEVREVKLNLEYDFKRRPVNPRMQLIGCVGVTHLAFDTVPWETVEDALLARLIFDEWRRSNCLKNLEDYNNWQAHYAFQLSNRRRVKMREEISPDASPSAERESNAARSVTGRVYKTRESGYMGVAIRTFLTAYVQRQWGLADVDMSQSQLATWLTEHGYPTKLCTVKNAGRARLNESAAPPVNDVVKFLDVIMARFPTLEKWRFLASA